MMGTYAIDFNTLFISPFLVFFFVIFLVWVCNLIEEESNPPSLKSVLRLLRSYHPQKGHFRITADAAQSTVTFIKNNGKKLARLIRYCDGTSQMRITSALCINLKELKGKVIITDLFYEGEKFEPPRSWDHVKKLIRWFPVVPPREEGMSE